MSIFFAGARPTTGIVRCIRLAKTIEDLQNNLLSCPRDNATNTQSAFHHEINVSNKRLRSVILLIEEHNRVEVHSPIALHRLVVTVSHIQIRRRI